MVMLIAYLLMEGFIWSVFFDFFDWESREFATTNFVPS